MFIQTLRFNLSLQTITKHIKTLIKLLGKVNF